MKNLKIKNSQKGVSLIITFFIMIIILAVILSISVILYSEINVLKNMGNSMAAFYAAESGVEKVLYYDEQVSVPPTEQACTSNTDCTLPDICNNGFCEINQMRGLCTMFQSNSFNNINNSSGCPDGTDSTDCHIPQEKLADTSADLSDQTNGCNPTVCDNCQISFDTSIPFSSESYHTVASIETSSTGNAVFDIKSKGEFATAEREVDVKNSSTVEAQDAIKITNACANPISGEQGTSIAISANVSAMISPDTIAGVTATIQDANGNYYNADGSSVGHSVSISLTKDNPYCQSLLLPPGAWCLIWNTLGYAPASDFYVNLDAKDALAKPIHKYCPITSDTCSDDCP